MLIDLRTVADGTETSAARTATAAAGTTFSADVCIIGAGAAGITLARGLANHGLDICLLESGGFDHDSVTQSLGAGENVGMPYYELRDSRLRFFGGTTNIWGGRCAPLDDIDFETRDWVPHSGWPITKGDLAEGYQAAHRDLGIGPFEYGDALWKTHGAERPPFDQERFITPFWRFDEVRERFGANRCQDILDSPRVRVLIQANAVHLQARDNARGIEHVVIAGCGGQRARVNANAYVLACGGIENARLLLASRDVESGGLGNRYDQVGRYFMEHPHGRLGRMHAAGAHALWNSFRKRFPGATSHQGRSPPDATPVAAVLAPAPGLQRQLGILNTALTFKWQRDPRLGVPVPQRLYQDLKHKLDPNRKNRQLWHVYRRLSSWYQRHLAPTLTHAQARLPGRRLSVMIRAEQAPNPDSRIRLSEHRDTLGYPVADLEWRLGAQDKYTLQQLAQTLDAELARLGLGRLQAESWLDAERLAWPIDSTVGNHPIGGYHHMGTTRMSESPSNGVVDRNCAVHGYENLYVAGSSVFSTGGWANPTLTILALAHRLKDHLVSRKVAARSAASR